MAVSPINAAGAMNTGSIGQLTQVGSGSGQVNGSDSSGTSFADYLKNAIGNVNDTISQAQNLQQQLATGQIDDIHSVMIAAEKADLSLQFTLAIRNKVMDAYTEIMRMQV